MAEVMFLDIEDCPDRLLLVGSALDDGRAHVDMPPAENGDCQDWRGWLLDEDVVKVSHTPYDLRRLRHFGYPSAGPFHNTAVMAWVLDENQPLDLDSLTLKYLGPDRHKRKRLTQRNNRVWFDARWALEEYASWPDHIRWEFMAYNVKDVELLRDLYIELRRHLRGSEWEEYWQEEEVPYSRLLVEMEGRGMPVDLEATKELADELRVERDAAAVHLRKVAQLPEEFNLNSPPQLRQYLFTDGYYTMPGRVLKGQVPAGFDVRELKTKYAYGTYTIRGRGLAPTPPPKRKDREADGLPSTAAKELLYKHPSDPWVRELCLTYRRYTKLLGTYLDKLPKVARDGRIYGQYNQTGTVTGRLSSSNPNMQNIPSRGELGKRVRALFKGRFVIGDYDSLEMRIMAHLSQDRRLLQVFREGGDPHALTAHAIFGVTPEHDDPERDQGKLMNYSIGYGAGPKQVAMDMTLAGYPTTMGMAKSYVKEVEAFYPQLTRYKERVKWRAKETGAVTTRAGRRRRIEVVRGGGDTTWKQMMYGERQAVNAEVQGTAADIFRRCLLASDELFHDVLFLLAQIHDEAVWEYEEVPDAEMLGRLRKVMEEGHGLPLSVPLVFEPLICEDWSQKGEGARVSIEEVE